MHLFLIIAFATLLTASEAFAKVAAVSFTNLVAQSELIVVATVESVTSPLFGKRYAKARVTEIWKGTNPNTVEFLASPTWTCDISEARKGETVLLFLTKGGESRSYMLAHSGRGRLPFRTVDGKDYVTIPSGLIIPEGTPTIAGPEPKWEFIRSVELKLLRNLVKNVPQE